VLWGVMGGAGVGAVGREALLWCSARSFGAGLGPGFPGRRGRPGCSGLAWVLR